MAPRFLRTTLCSLVLGVAANACGVEFFDSLESASKAEPKAKAPPKKAQAAPKKPQTPARVAGKEPGKSPKAQEVPLQRWVLNPKTSKVQLVVLKATGQHIAKFGSIQGHLKADDSTWKELFVVVETASLKADVPAFGAHVRSAQFLDVAKYPKAVFRSSEMKISRKAKSPTGPKMSGFLSLHGIEKPIQFPVQIKKQSPGKVEINVKVPVDPKAYNMPGSKLTSELIDGVELELELRFLESK